MGGLLVALAAVGVFLAYVDATAPPVQEWVVARGEIRPGTRLAAEDLATVLLDLPPPLQERAFTDPQQLVGAVAVSPLAPFELIHASDVVHGTASGLAELSFALDTSRAAGGRLAGGDRVHVLATYGTGGDASTMAVVRDALVIAVAPGEGLAGQSSVVLTLGLEGDNAALALAHAVNAGDLVVVRVTEAGQGPALRERYRPEPLAAQDG